MKIFYFACLFLITLIISGNGNAQQPRFKFGISAPLSGVLAEYGVAVRNGIELAKKDRPAEFSKIELFFEDSQWDPKTAIAAFNMLREVKKAQLIYNWGNPTSEAVAPLADRLEFPVIAMSSDPAITRDRKYIIRSLRSATELGSLLARHLVAQGYRNIGIVLAENSYVQGLYEGLQPDLKNADVTVEILGRFNLAEQDFKSTISKMKHKHFDAIGVLLITGQVQSFFKQMQAQSVSLPAFGADFFGSRTEIEASGAGIEGAIFPDLGVTTEFRKKYQGVFGNDIQIAFAANAYDVVTQVALNFSDSKSIQLPASEIVQRLKRSQPLKGAHGNFAFVESSQYGPAFVSDIVIRKIQHGDIEDLK